MEDDTVFEGMPAGPVFLPLAKYKLKHLTGLAQVTIPMRGTYPAESPLQGEFDLCPEPGMILLGSLTQTIMALGKYPSLAPNQRFVAIAVELDGSDIRVVGRVIELVED